MPSFKHGKFDDSEILRNLERQEHKKNAQEPIAIKKVASSSEPVLFKSNDNKKSNDLMQNIVKLCSGLRNDGLYKQADELEENYFNYKKANALYDVSKETGEDLIHKAHPNGSFQFKDVDGEAIFHTIVDKHNKIKAIVDKKPTGQHKQASYADLYLKNDLKMSTSNKDASRNIIDAVKISLADNITQNKFNTLKASILTKLNNLKNYIKNVANLPDNIGNMWGVLPTGGSEGKKELALHIINHMISDIEGDKLNNGRVNLIADLQSISETTDAGIFSNDLEKNVSITIDNAIKNIKLDITEFYSLNKIITNETQEKSINLETQKIINTTTAPSVSTQSTSNNAPTFAALASGYTNAFAHIKEVDELFKSKNINEPYLSQLNTFLITKRRLLTENSDENSRLQHKGYLVKTNEKIKELKTEHKV